MAELNTAAEDEFSKHFQRLHECCITVFGTYRTTFREMINKHNHSITVFITF